MALAGKAVLAIWNDVVAGFEQEFEEWHVREHIPERVGLPGWLRGRRYVAAAGGEPVYFNFYEAADVQALLSPAYQARLNDPTRWTRHVVARFANTIRTLCDVEFSIGAGSGGVIETVRLGAMTDDPRWAARLRSEILEPLSERKGITGVHLLRRSGAGGSGDTAETALRGPDLQADWIVLIEAIGAEPILAAREAHDFGAAPERGIYRLQYDLASTQIQKGTS